MAEAFGYAATAELDSLVPAERTGDSVARHLARFFARTTGERYDAVSRLRLNARHLSRYRPVLRDRVAVQEAAWRGRLSDLIGDGVERGEFRTEDPHMTAIQILVVLDGLGAHANTDTGGHPEAVARMAVTTAERELGLAPGTLTRPTDAAGS